MRQVGTIQDVVDWGLCVGCGACFYACDKGAVSLFNLEPVGIRPSFDPEKCAGCTKCLSICPGHFLDADLMTRGLEKKSAADHEFGPVLEIWEGHAADPEIRLKASSGGMLSALSLYCLEREGMEFVLHSGMDPEKPWLNKTVQSRNRAELVDRAGSRYAPASPCEGLGAVEASAGKCVFIGKPCDSAAASMLVRERKALDEKVGLILSFFCAGTPSTAGTKDVLKSLDLTPEEIDSLRYRGEGWPGRFRALYSQRMKEKSYSYMESWGKLTKYRPMRCNLCPDGLGRLSDITCGDAWDEFEDGGDDPGRSLVLVRTARGREILHRAKDAGYVILRPAGSERVLKAQKNLLERRRQLFGRLFAMKLLAIPTPKFVGFSLMRSWLQLPAGMKLRTVLGTLRRLATRGLWRRQLASGVEGPPRILRDGTEGK